MSPRVRAIALTIMLAPVAGVVVAVVLLWQRAVGPLDLALLGGGYLLSGFGVTVGFHRLLTHGGFATSRPVRYAFAVLGSTAAEGPVISWVADHRKHHAFADQKGDPHSPHLDRDGELSGLRGLWHAHVGWMYDWRAKASPRRYAKDLGADAGLRFIDRRFLWWVALGLVVPFAIGLAVRGSVTGGLTALVWGGLVRIFLLHHATWSINSITHVYGRRPWKTKDRSGNVAWLALPTLGESWHNNHHAFPASALHGMGARQPDPSAWLIRGLARVGLARDVVIPSAERRRSKVAAPV